MGSVAGEALDYFLEENPNDAKAILSKCVLTAKARLAARAARSKRGLRRPGLPIAAFPQVIFLANSLSRMASKENDGDF